jgi:hypothetical protein
MPMSDRACKALAEAFLLQSLELTMLDRNAVVSLFYTLNANASNGHVRLVLRISKMLIGRLIRWGFLGQS